MFRAKTVFVLGAGASAEVGLPVGEKLKEKITEKINIKFRFGAEQESGDYRVTRALRELAHQSNGGNGDINPYLQAACRLCEALPLAISIDNLMDAHKNDEMAKVCGKLGIVSSILEAERSSALFSPEGKGQRLNFDNVRDTWFVKFFQLLTESVARDDVNSVFENISFVSFNYDRCLEHYLHEALQTYYALDVDAVTKIMTRLKIFHPYGSVGKLPWQELDKELQVPYGADRYNLLNVSNQIKTFNETVDEKAEIEHVAQKIREAKVIVFLGFAFHEQNLKLLDPKMNSDPKRVYATTYGISDSNRTVIMSAIGDLLGSNQDVMPAAKDFKNEFKCTDLLNEYSRSLTAP